MQTLSRFFLFFTLLATVFSTPAGAQAPPTELEGSWSVTDSVNELRWHVPDTIPGPEYYNIFRKLDGDPSFSLLDTAFDRRYDDGAVVLGNTYLYRVTAVYSGSIQSMPSNTVTVTAGGDSIPGGNVGTLPPRDLIGSFDNRGAVELDWFSPDSGQNPASYRVYRAPAFDSLFSQIASVPEAEYDDTLIQENTGYSYYVTAFYTGDFESIPSNTVHVQTLAFDDSTGDSTSHQVQFTSTPVNSGQVGEPYLYQATVETTPPGLQVCYELNHAPAGMSVDSSGIVSWIPGTLGIFEVELKARVCGMGESEDAEQGFYVMVLSGDAAQIYGVVTDSVGSPLDSIRIKIFDVTSGAFVLKARTDIAGIYEFPVVNPGTYFIRADADDTPFEDVWYVNSRELSGATPVVVGAGTTVEINFTLAPEHEDSAVDYSFTGTVRDTAGNPVAGAKISMMKRYHEYGDDDDFFDDHFHHEHHHGDDDSVRNTTTDSTGAYQIITRTGDYIVRAKAPGYFEQYWDGQPSPLEASILSLHRDTSGIDFALTPKPGELEGTGSIAGTIRRADTQTPIRAEVIGFMKNGSGEFTGLISSDHTDTNGVYTLDELPAGFYLVMVKGEDGIVSSFYSLSGGTPFMDSASLVSVAAVVVEGIDIDVMVDSAEGLNDISGEVEIEIETPGKNAPRLPNAAAPLAGAVATVIDGSGRVVGSAVSGQDGNYTSPGLAPGSYTVIFQKPGAGTTSEIGAVAYQGGLPSSTILNAALLPDAGPGSVQLFGVNAGWNLVSVPRTVPDYAPTAIFPTASPIAYAYAGSYQASSLLENGRGYWLKFGAGQTVTVGGADNNTGSVQLVKGWNIIGSLSTPVPLTSTVTTPPGLIISDVFGYDGGYHSTTVLEPGRGYWLKSSGNGSLQFAATNDPVAASWLPGPETVGDPAGIRLTFTDDYGNRQVLMLEGGGSKPQVSAELPPAPPAGAFDVRYASGTWKEYAGGENPGTRTYLVDIHPVDGSTRVTVDGNINGVTLKFADTGGNEFVPSRDGSPPTDLGNIHRLVVTVVNEGIPEKFSLLQNYPNPFNPVTTIRYELPSGSRVTLKVYNAIGQLVGTLVEEERPAGIHTTVWDATGYASGVYFFRIDAVSTTNPGEMFIQTKKMVVLK